LAVICISAKGSELMPKILTLGLLISSVEAVMAQNADHAFDDDQTAPLEKENGTTKSGCRLGPGHFLR